MSHPLKTEHLPNITPIRFFLALLVVIAHISQFSENRGFPFFNDLPIFHKATEAVSMFFSLSGFLIINQLYKEKTTTNTINLKGFYLRRILRIFPLYYLVLIFGFLYYHFILPYFGFEFENNYDVITGIILSASFFPNIFSTFSPGGILEILWSIGIEEQFYLLIAPLFFIVPAKRILPFLGAFTLLYFSVFFTESLLVLREYNMLYFYFSFSGLCAILRNNTYVKQFLKTLKYPILLVFLLYFLTSYFYLNLPPMAYHGLSVVLFGFTITILAQKPIKILENKAMNYLGKISYGIYMYHAISIQAVGLIYLKTLSKLGLDNTIAIVVINLAVIGLTITASHFSYTYFESYFLKLKNKTRVKRIMQKG